MSTNRLLFFATKHRLHTFFLKKKTFERLLQQWAFNISLVTKHYHSGML